MGPIGYNTSYMSLSTVPLYPGSVTDADTGVAACYYLRPQYGLYLHTMIRED
jgi:hypothetical protein